MIGHLDFVRTSWGGYWVDPFEIDKAERLGQRWAEETIAEFRRYLERLGRSRKKKRSRRRKKHTR